MNPLVELQTYGQSFWYDNMRRKYLNDDTLKNLIQTDGLRGMTSNPSIFQKAIGNSDDYDDQFATLLKDGVTGANEIFDALAVADIQAACDLFAHLYEKSDGGDGFVSLEVSPTLAHETEKTIEEARRLYKAVDRPNVMIKVPATPEGIPAIRQLISEGINVNITLMFSMEHYEDVAQAYIEGLQALIENGGDPHKVASVASFFVSRVDSAVDKQLEALNDPAAKALMGKVAIANSKVVYQRFQDIFHSDVFADLLEAGARRQRLLWASTSTKNPDYRDTLYVEELIGPETVNTMPPETMNAFRDHGELANTLEDDVDGAYETLDQLADLGIDLDEITDELQVEGVRKFADSFTELMAAIETKRGQMQPS